MTRSLCHKQGECISVSIFNADLAPSLRCQFLDDGTFYFYPKVNNETSSYNKTSTGTFSDVNNDRESALKG